MSELFSFSPTVYYIWKGHLKSANKQYTSIKNDYEMIFNSDTMVEECLGSNDSVPKVSYNLVPLSQIGSMEDNATVGESNEHYHLSVNRPTELFHVRFKMLVAFVVTLVKSVNLLQRPLVVN